MSSASRSLRPPISTFRSRKPPQPQPSAAAKGGRTRPKTPSKPPISQVTSAAPSTRASDRPDSSKAQENVTVTVRFRPLSAREINKGDEIAWYANGDCTVRNEYNPSIAYGFGF